MGSKSDDIFKNKTKNDKCLRCMYLSFHAAAVVVHLVVAAPPEASVVGDHLPASFRVSESLAAGGCQKPTFKIVFDWFLGSLRRTYERKKALPMRSVESELCNRRFWAEVITLCSAHAPTFLGFRQYRVVCWVSASHNWRVAVVDRGDERPETPTGANLLTARGRRERCQPMGTLQCEINNMLRIMYNTPRIRKCHPSIPLFRPHITLCSFSQKGGCAEKTMPILFIVSVGLFYSPHLGGSEHF